MKVLRAADGGKLIVEGKALQGDLLAGGSIRQTVDPTNRNIVQGAANGVRRRDSPKPNSHPDGCCIYDADTRQERAWPYPGRSRLGSLRFNAGEKSAEVIVRMAMRKDRIRV